jgi:hypothetical protein
MAQILVITSNYEYAVKIRILRIASLNQQKRQSHF